MVPAQVPAWVPAWGQAGLVASAAWLPRASAERACGGAWRDDADRHAGLIDGRRWTGASAGYLGRRVARRTARRPRLVRPPPRVCAGSHAVAATTPRRGSMGDSARQSSAASTRAAGVRAGASCLSPCQRPRCRPCRSPCATARPPARPPSAGTGRRCGRAGAAQPIATRPTATSRARCAASVSPRAPGPAHAAPPAARCAAFAPRAGL